jgi:cleavage and polyadenylation specificity factor subunit 5
MLQIANAFFKLPGDYLLPHEEEIPGFQARLSERLSPSAGSAIPGADSDLDGEADGQQQHPIDWRIHDCVAQWWRPNFETFMYPFIPAHVTRPKECKKMYLIQLPKKSMFLLLPVFFFSFLWSKADVDVWFRNVICTQEYEITCSSVV